MAGLDGIKSDLSVPTSTEENLYQLDQASLAKLSSTPGSLGEAMVELAQSELVKATFGADLFEQYVVGRRKEWDEYRLDVSQWELDRYLPVY